MTMRKYWLGSLAAALLLAVSAQADVITPVSVTPSSEFAAAINLINGSGLDGVGPVEDQLHNNDENSMWQSFSFVSSIGESVTFELDANYDLSDAIIWQYNGLNGFGLPEPDRELDEIELAVSPDLVSGFTSIGTFNLAAAQDQTAGGFNEPAQEFALAGASNVRRVMLTINSVQGGMDDGTAGLSEVRFRGTLVPEPATLGLLALGVSSLLFARRRSG